MVMRGVLLGLKPPSDRWCHLIHRRYPSIRTRIETMVPVSANRHVEVASLHGRGAGEAVEEVRGLPNVEAVTLIDQAREVQRVRLQIRGCALARLMRDTALIPQFPIVLSRDSEQWFVHADVDAVAAGVQELEREGFEVVQHPPQERESLYPDLTVRQEEILDLAVEEGFYAYPRRMTLTQLAGRVGVSKSTLSESLMVIENKVMRAQAAQRFAQ